MSPYGGETEGFRKKHFLLKQSCESSFEIRALINMCFLHSQIGSFGNNDLINEMRKGRIIVVEDFFYPL